MSGREHRLVEGWAQTGTLDLHVAICLLGGEWRKCGWCRPVMRELWPAVRRHQQERRARVRAAPPEPPR